MGRLDNPGNWDTEPGAETSSVTISKWSRYLGSHGLHPLDAVGWRFMGRRTAFSLVKRGTVFLSSSERISFIETLAY